MPTKEKEGASSSASQDDHSNSSRQQDALQLHVVQTALTSEGEETPLASHPNLLHSEAMLPPITAMTIKGNDNNSDNNSDGQENAATSTSNPCKQRQRQTVRRNNPPVNPPWTRLTETWIHQKIPEAITAVALTAARRPRLCLLLMAACSLAVLTLGLLTNFTLNIEEFEVFAPFGVRPRTHQRWISEQSGFDQPNHLLAVFVHDHGDNVLTLHALRRSMDAYEAVQSLPNYKTLCSSGQYDNDNNTTTTTTTTTAARYCRVSSPLRFWNFSRQLMEDSITSEQDILDKLSQETYPDGTPVDLEAILGNPQYNNSPTNNNNNSNSNSSKSNQQQLLLTMAQGLTTAFSLPHVEDLTAELESDALEAIFPLQQQQQDNNNNANDFLSLEVLSKRSYPDEFMRAIVKDLPLIPLVFLVMAMFTCSILYRRDKIHSRMLLGIGAVVTIVMSLMTGYGLMFLCGVPFTNMTQSVPFVLFGVGLDDTFIITGAFLSRTTSSKNNKNNNNNVQERIQQTMQDVGLSIFVTTLTTAVAFGLGSVSSIPAVRWLCLYSMTTIVIDFVYQITFFVALLVLDEQRIQQRRRDACVCVTVVVGEEESQRVNDNDDEEGEADQEQLQEPPQDKAIHNPNFVDRFMGWYSETLLNPIIKGIVLIVFAALFAVCAYSSSKLRQEFEVTELLPRGSYVTSFLDAFDRYSSRALPIYAYFRNIDQSDDNMQQQMIRYMEDLAALDQFGDPPFCWVRDVRELLDTDQEVNTLVGNLTFHEQLQVLLSIPSVREVYGDNIVFDDNGDIVASRCILYAEKLNVDDVDEQTDLLHAQKEVTANQPVNKEKPDEWSFFTYDDLYLTWEFYDAIIKEWIFTTIVGVIAVTTVGFVCLPHWTATFIVLPMIGMLYVDLIGKRQELCICSGRIFLLNEKTMELTKIMSML